jgi:hypothetical protein
MILLVLDLIQILGPGGGVFILVEKSITSVEQTSLITDGEIE